MRKIIFLILFTNFNIVAYNQVIKGTILDKQNNDKISSALVYFSGTFIRTNTDKNGKFELNLSKFTTMPLTVSASGYYSVTLSVVSPEKPVFIYLKPKEDRLKQVVSTYNGSDKKRKENLRLFKNTFLGTSPNARNCEITNEDDIIFISEPDNDTLRAFSSKPILIDNSALGYKIAYFLDEFELCKNSSTFFLSGNLSFNEDLNTADTKKVIFEIRRQKTYIKSRMFFFRSLWENKFDSTKLMIKNSEDKFLNYSQIVFQEDSLIKYLIYPGTEDVSRPAGLSSFYTVFSESDVYYDKDGNFDPSSVSIISLEKNVFFDKSGYFDPAGVSWQGRMAKQRIADLLPYEYSVK